MDKKTLMLMAGSFWLGFITAVRASIKSRKPKLDNPRDIEIKQWHEIHR